MAPNTNIDVIAEVRVASEGSGSLRASFDTARARKMGPNFKVLSAISADLYRSDPLRIGICGRRSSAPIDHASIRGLRHR
jgi:hypothetical protein